MSCLQGMILGHKSLSHFEKENIRLTHPVATQLQFVAMRAKHMVFIISSSNRSSLSGHCWMIPFQFLI